MRRFFLLESAYKALGLIITMLQARILGPGAMGEFQFYQGNVFGYLNSASLLSTDYKNIIAYKADPAYVEHDEFYVTLAVKSVMLILAYGALFALWPSLGRFSLLPYFLALGFNLLQFDFLVYGHNIQAPFAAVRLLSQVLSLAVLALFWFGLVDVYWFTSYQLIQTGTLNLGIFILVRRYFQFDWGRYRRALFGLRPAAFADLGRYFVTNQFVTYVTTIEAVLLGLHGLTADRHVFNEGQRLAQVLAPWVVFYLNYNIGKTSAQFPRRIFQLVLGLLLLSPLTTVVLYGKAFVDHIYQYNYFLMMFLMMAMLQEKNLHVLAGDRAKVQRLARLNLGFFLLSTAAMYGILALSWPLESVLLVFVAKLLSYHGIFDRMFGTRWSPWFLPAALLVIAVLNKGLALLGYYQSASHWLIDAQQAGIAWTKSWVMR